MSWSASLSGEFHEVVKALRNLHPTGDPKAVEYGHTEIAKEMALCAVDKAPTGVKFAISLSGHTASKTSYNVYANVSTVELPPDA